MCYWVNFGFVQITGLRPFNLLEFSLCKVFTGLHWSIIKTLAAVERYRENGESMRVGKFKVVAAATVTMAIAACVAAAPAFAEQWFVPTVADGSTVTLNPGDKATTDNIYYKWGANSSVSYVSSDSNVAITSGDTVGYAIVMGGGLNGQYESHSTTITAVRPGTSVITASDRTGVVATYTVNVNKYKVKLPVATKSVSVYNGDEQVFFEDGEQYTVEAGSATDVGAYTAIATLKDTSAYQWSDGTIEPKRLTFVIEKAGCDIEAWTAKTTYKCKPTKKQFVKVKYDHGNGKVTFKSNTKGVKVDKKGKVTIPKGFKGKVTIVVKDSGDVNHHGGSTTVKFKVKK